MMMVRLFSVFSGVMGLRFSEMEEGVFVCSEVRLIATIVEIFSLRGFLPQYWSIPIFSDEAINPSRSAFIHRIISTL